MGMARINGNLTEKLPFGMGLPVKLPQHIPKIHQARQQYDFNFEIRTQNPDEPELAQKM